MLFRSGWLEVLGCGVVDQNVFDAVGYKDKSGYAFGLGIENGSYKGISGFVNKNQLAQTFLEESLTKQDPISHIQEVINQIIQKIQKLKESKNTENPEDKNNITNEIDQLKHTLETAEKVKKALELNQKLKDLSLNNKEEIRQLFSIIQESFQLIKELTDNPKLKLAKEFKIDPSCVSRIARI